MTAGDRRLVLPTGIREHNAMCIVRDEMTRPLLILVMVSTDKKVASRTGMVQTVASTAYHRMIQQGVTTATQLAVQRSVYQDGLDGNVPFSAV